MVLIFKSLVDLWRERLVHLDALLAKQPYDSWRLRAEHKVLGYLVRRFENDVPAWPLGPRSARRLDSVQEFKPVVRVRGLVRDAQESKDAPAKDKPPTCIFLSAEARRNLQLWNPEVDQPLPPGWHRAGEPQEDGLWHEYSYLVKEPPGSYRQEMERQLNLYMMDPNRLPPQPPETSTPWYWRYDGLILFLIWMGCLAAFMILLAHATR